jgi:hypothetical protein
MRSFAFTGLDHLLDACSIEATNAFTITTASLLQSISFIAPSLDKIFDDSEFDWHLLWIILIPYNLSTVSKRQTLKQMKISKNQSMDWRLC